MIDGKKYLVKILVFGKQVKFQYFQTSQFHDFRVPVYVMTYKVLYA